jgi:cyclomaltodextrinase
MQLAALYHVCRAPLAFPVGPAHLRVVLKAAKGDLASATCLFGDRYSWPLEKDTSLPLEPLGNDGMHEYWGVTLPVPTRRVRYLLYLTGVDGTRTWLSENGISPRRPKNGAFQYAYIHKGDRFVQPDWIKASILYQIFPDRFCNGDPTNDPEGTTVWGQIPTPSYMAGGDLEGIRQKLDYILDLGITCIYTTPLFLAPSNHKYDTTDYFLIDPTFGTNAEFMQLVSEAHVKGMRFLLDAVFNHAGKEWAPFVDVVEKGKESAYVDWFYDLKSFPVDPERSNYETFANENSYMPKLNTTNPAAAKHLLDAAAFWIEEAAIDGWRLDVSNEVDHDFWRAFRKRVKGAKADAFIFGEIWHDSTDWLQGDQYDSVMNYPWREATLAYLAGQIDSVEYDQLLTRQRFTYQAEIARGMVNLLGSHDTARITTELGSLAKAAQAAVLLLTSEGMPMIYYGDEIGLEGETDPFSRNCYPWYDPDTQDAGMLSLYKRLIQIRHAYPWLNDGAWATFLADPITNVLGYRRLPTPLVSPDRAPHEPGLAILINGSGAPAKVALPGKGPWVDLLAGQIQTGKVEGDHLLLPAHGVAILAPKKLAKEVR